MARFTLSRRVGLWATTLALVSIASATPVCPGLVPASDPKAAPGVEYKVLVNKLARPRGIIQDTEGNLLVVESSGKGITRIVLDNGDKLDVCVESSAQLISESTVRLFLHF